MFTRSMNLFAFLGLVTILLAGPRAAVAQGDEQSLYDRLDGLAPIDVAACGANGGAAFLALEIRNQ